MLFLLVMGSNYFPRMFFPSIASSTFYFVLWVYTWSVRLCLSFVACAAVLLCIWWRGGGGPGGRRGCCCRPARLPWRNFGVCAGGASRSYDGRSPRAPVWWGEPCQSSRVRPPLNQCSARTLLLFLPRWVIPCTPALALKGLRCRPKSAEVDFQLMSSLAAVREMLLWGNWTANFLITQIPTDSWI